MAVSIAERVQLAQAAGFHNSDAIEALSIIVAISLAECGVGSACETGCNPDAAGVSCGLLQVYQPAHPGTASCASDPACCFQLGYQISNGATSFSPWSTYTGGQFRQYLGAVRAALGAPAPPPSPVPPGGGTSLPPGGAPQCPPGWTQGGDFCYPPSAVGLAPLLLLAGAGGAALIFEGRHHAARPSPMRPEGRVRFAGLNTLIRR